MANKYESHVCPEEECTIYERKLPKVKANFGIYGGTAAHKINFGGLIESDYSFDVLFGLKLEVQNILDMTERLSFCVDLSYMRLSNFIINGTAQEMPWLSVNYNNENYLLTRLSLYDEITEDLKVNLKANVIRIPFTFNYYILKSKQFLYVWAE